VALILAGRVIRRPAREYDAKDASGKGYRTEIVLRTQLLFLNKGRAR